MGWEVSIKPKVFRSGTYVEGTISSLDIDGQSLLVIDFDGGLDSSLNWKYLALVNDNVQGGVG